MHDTKRLLIVDDDPQICELLRTILIAEHFNVAVARDGAEMLAALAHQSFDLVTLDLGLPGMSGIELAREVCFTTDIPLIVVSGRSDDYDRIISLEIGADDYIMKPFNCRELIARVRAVLRRCAGKSRRQGLSSLPASSAFSTEMAFHNYRLNPQTRELRNSDGAMTGLTSAECKLLEVLIEHAGRACTRDEISARIKGRSWSPLDRSLDTLVARLRRKIEPVPGEPALLMSVRGVGYMMTVR